MDDFLFANTFYDLERQEKYMYVGQCDQTDKKTYLTSD